MNVFVAVLTVGIIQKSFTIESVRLQIVDVGGQDTERRKWITCFAEVDCVIFVISLNCYDEMVTSRADTNCMVDALTLFEETVSNEGLKGMQFILFLNKKDLFANKILKVPITDCPAFADFDQFDDPVTIHRNPHDYEQTTSFIKAKFEAAYRPPTSPNGTAAPSLFTHIICARDRQSMDEMFKSIKCKIITNNLHQQELC